MSHRAPAAFTRFLAVWVACLFLVGGLAAYAHQAWVSHAVCAQHGELVHAGEHAPDRDDDEGPVEADTHEHCQLGPVTGSGAELELGAPCTHAPLVVTARMIAPARQPAPASVDLRLAPKTSPPRA